MISVRLKDFPENSIALGNSFNLNAPSMSGSIQALRISNRFYA